MKLYDNWKTIVKEAWSIRFMMIAIICECAQVVLPIYTDRIPENIFTVLTILAVAGGIISRTIYQQNV